jgi:GxxExxY protein
MFVKTPLAEKVIGCAIEVHRTLGPGLLESTYQACLKEEFRCAEVRYLDQVPIPVRYRGVDLDCAYRLDFVVDEALVVEVKCVERTLPIHKAQLLTYLRLTGLPQGLLLNFHAAVLRHGITSVVNNLSSHPSGLV